MWPFSPKPLPWQFLDEERSHLFHQKIVKRMLEDRNPLLVEMEDKYLARNYVEEKGGCDLPDLIWWSEDIPVRIPWEKLPERYVIKTNHWSGDGVFIVNNTDEPIKSVDSNMTIPELYKILHNGVDQAGKKWSQGAIERKLGRLLRKCYPRSMEWATQNISPRGVMIEELLLDKDDAIPEDIKLHCFHGKVGFIQADFNRFSDHQQNIHSADGMIIEQSNPHIPGNESVQDLSMHFGNENLHHLIEIAENLAEGIDYTRVDLFLVRDNVIFGEFTAYHQAGHPQSKEWEELGGQLWDDSDQ